MNSFYTYSKRIEPARSAFEAGNQEDSLEVPMEYLDSSDSQLYCLEAARVNQGFMDLSPSVANFEQAFEEFNDNESAAKYTLTGIFHQAGSLFVNDNAVDYVAPEFERIFAYTYQCLNHLLLGDVSSAEIISRKALNEQRFFEQSHEGDMHQATVAQSANAFQSNLGGAMSQMNKAAGLVANKYENPLTYFLSGIVSEVQGDYNDAVVSYRKGLKVIKGSPLFVHSIMNVENRFFSGAHSFKQLKYLELPRASFGEVVVVVDDGLIPLKREVKIPFPTGSGVTMVSFPLYQEEVKPAEGLAVQVGRSNVPIYPICNVYGMASKNFQDQVAILVTKTIARVAGKVAMQVALEHEFGDMGAVISSFWNIFSERADTRGWSFLPYYVQAGRSLVPVGQYKLKLGGVFKQTIIIRKNRKTLLYVNRVGGKLSYKVVNL
jgi:hypothetical protein